MDASQETRWFKSSYSGGSGTECVECAHVGVDTLIRDSKQREGSSLRVRRTAWRLFVRALEQDSFV